MRNLIRTRYVRPFLLVALAAVGLGVVAPSPNAAPGPLTVTAVTWDVVGLDSNNVNTGPNVFPVGIRVCNTGSDPVTNVVGTWAWKTSQNAFTGPAEGTTVSVGTMAGGYCRQVFFEVTLNRSPSSRLKSRDYQITVTGDGGLTASGTQRQLYVEKLVSQGRNNTKKLAGPGGCNLAYTVCDPAPTNLVIGKTYTYKFYAETSTAYQQLETFVNFPASVVQVVSTSATYSNPSGATSSSLYADACGWSTVPTNRSCVGPPNIAGGKAGGRVVVTYTVRAVAPGSGTLKSTIYDFSGSSYHYNSDHDSFALITGPLNARYGLDTTIAGNGKVTSAPAGTLTNGTSSGIDCGATTVICSVGYATGTVVTLTAQPLGTDIFVGWSGDGCSGVSLTCIVTMSQSRSVNATFTGVMSYQLDVSKTGAGSVTADVGSLNCGATCASMYTDGTVVTLTASPTANWTFNGWSGEGCSGTGTCQVTMSQARSVTAAFIEQTFPLSVSVIGNGTVAASAGAISCGNGNTFCTEVYGSGVVVTLTATPGSGQTFLGWVGGDCAGIALTCNVTMSQARSATALFSGVASYPLDVGVGGSASGTVTSDVGGINCGATCSATYADGTVVTLTATAAGGSSFVGWSGDCSGTSTTCIVTMSQARSAFANFGAPQTLTVTKTGSGTGTVTSDIAGINCGATCSASFGDGTVVTLTASVSSGSIFTGWSGDCSGTGTCTVTMSAARSVTATFVAAYTLAVTKTGSGTGTVTSDVGGLSCGATCSVDYADGTVVTLTATAASGSRFTGWSGACSGTGTCTVTMSAARNVTAGFIALYTLTVTKSGSGTGSVSGSGINCGLTCSADYDDGTVVTLTAGAASGSRFSGWSGACSGTGTCTVTMSAARNVTATFIALYTLTVTKSGSGTGTVTSDVGGVSCGATCSADFDDGTVVTLTGTAASGSRFSGWSGACSGTSTCTVTMSAARNVTANFVALYTLTVTRSGSGSGNVAGNGIDCGPTCSLDYDDGTVVTLTATASSGSRFTGWSGAGCSGTGTCTVTMSAARNVTASFIALYTLTVTRSGSGTGTVTSDVGGVSCGATCSVVYDDGTVVTLTAAAASGSRFTGWSGAGCSGTGTCTVTMSAARNVTASFIALYTLTVTRSGSGTGGASGSGINCGLTCSLDYDDGTVVTLTATAASGSRFSGWSGACSGTSTCTVTMSAARNVTANFIALYTLTVTKSGSGSVSGNGINCGPTCSLDFDDGTVVTLTATAASGSRFSGWSGACSGTSTCTVTMSAARNVSASFIALYPLTVTKSGSGSGSAAGSGIDCGSTCSLDYDDGASVTLTATPASASLFNGWSGACSGTSTCSVTMSSARNVTAEFTIMSGPLTPAVYRLTVAKTGSGAGVVIATGIDCGATCLADYFAGTNVALTAGAASGSHFTGWSGEGCSGTGSCTVAMSQARHVTAEFVYRLARLQIVVNGRGTVVGRSAGIRCRTACNRRYDARRRVTLVARPRAAHWFTGWSGACHGTAPTCTVTMARARQVRANFARELELRLQVTAGLVYHLPHERALVKALATWRGRPLAGGKVRLVVTCPRQRTTAVVRTGRNGRVVFPFGSRLPNAVRVYTCRVTARIAARGRTATSPRPGTLRFIHPLWLETKRGQNGSVVVRIWGRSGEAVELLADGRAVAHARINRKGWVEITLPGLRLHRLSVRGGRDHHSHVISG